MRTIWHNETPLFGTFFAKKFPRPRSRFMAGIGYHIALWLILGLIYSSRAVYQGVGG